MISEALNMQGLLRLQANTTEEGKMVSAEEEINSNLKDLITSVHMLGKSGSMSINIGFKPVGNGVFDVTTEVSIKKPKGSRLPVRAYTDPRGNIYEDHPGQTKLPLASKVHQLAKDIV